MRWNPRGRSRNLEDRRHESRGPLRFPGAGLPGLRLPRGRTPRLGIGGVVVLLALLWLLGGDMGQLLGGADTQVSLPGDVLPGAAQRGPEPSAAGSPREETLVEFVSFVLDDLQATWGRLLPGYREAKLVLFRDAVRSGCGYAAAQMGPFYCPVDEKVYIDLDFYELLSQRFRAPGDFAQAYVLAHEIGHHVQKQIGIEAEVRRAQQARPGDANELSVRMELQADCLAGVWGHHAAQRDLLETGDLEEGLGAASAIGDDRMQSMAGGRIQPESFTHGSSEQRVHWFRRGLESGDANACDSFGGA